MFWQLCLHQVMFISIGRDSWIPKSAQSFNISPILSTVWNWLLLKQKQTDNLLHLKRTCGWMNYIGLFIMDVHWLQCWDSSRGSPIPGFEATFPLDLPKLLDSSGSLQMRLRLLRCERSEGHPVFCRSGWAGESAGLQSRMQGLSIMINCVHCEHDHCHVAMEYSTLIVVWRFVYLEVENRWCITLVCINLCCILKGPKLDSSRFCGISRWRQLCADVAPRASGMFPGCLVHLVLARLLHTWHRKLGRPGGMVGSVHICPVHSTMSPAHQHIHGYNDTMMITSFSHDNI